jgi:hypothetical protein
VESWSVVLRLLGVPGLLEVVSIPGQGHSLRLCTLFRSACHVPWFSYVGTWVLCKTWCAICCARAQVQ